MPIVSWLGSLFGVKPAEVPGQPASGRQAEDMGEAPVQIWVGLGNPGASYAMQRHNVGFMAVDAIAEVHGFDPPKKAFSGWAQQGRIGGQRILLLKPATFMNDSGRAVRAAMDFFKKDIADITIFHDELDLAPFKVKVKTAAAPPAITPALDRGPYRQRLPPGAHRHRPSRHKDKVTNMCLAITPRPSTNGLATPPAVAAEGDMAGARRRPPGS